MPVSFNVAKHPANLVPGANSDGLSPESILAEACPTQYVTARDLLGTSFSGDSGDRPSKGRSMGPPPIPTPTPAKAKRSRLSSLFARMKPVLNTPAVSDTPLPRRSPVSTSPAPTLDRLEIPTTSGFTTSVVPGEEYTPPLVPTNYIPNIRTPEPVAPRPPPVFRDPSLAHLRIHDVIPKTNGFVDTVISAYNQHHALILRPDDVWIAILTQFNFYVNANAEILRANFVAHEGKKALTVSTEAFGDFGLLARNMVDLIEKNVVDPSLRAWALPDFSTTTLNDTTVSSILLMATLKAYFEYVFCEICCGIPRVTLEGEKRDWENILNRLEKLKEYGIDTIAWYHLLVPVISRFVKAFDSPESANNVKFWQNVAHFTPGGSGPSYYSGWIAAFCAFNDKGQWLGAPLRSRDDAVAPDSLSAKQFWAAYSPSARRSSGPGSFALDDTQYHVVDCDNIPPSSAAVDVKLVSIDKGVEEDCVMVAGVIGTRATSESDSSTTVKDTVRPVLGWWLFNKK